MNNEVKKIDDKTSRQNFIEAIEMGLNGYTHLSKCGCGNFCLTTDNCRENGKLGGKPIMKPVAFVRSLPSDKRPYIILLAMGKSYVNQKGDVCVGYDPGYAYIFQVYKDEKGSIMLAECGYDKSDEVAKYAENNNYWGDKSTENSR